jgi:dimeric dUTPase (all-alpha-NTP-PPase superfamily)
MLETWYEYADMLHFFVNIGLALGITGDDLEKLYVTKNKENFDRQNRGY